MRAGLAVRSAVVVGLVCGSGGALRAEEIARGSSVTPAPSLRAPGVQVIDPRALAAHQYLYADFPRAAAALENERQLAAANVRALELRVASYQPFRSFHQYAATYTADIGWQLELMAARQRLACAENAQADLWRQRQLVAMPIAPGQ